MHDDRTLVEGRLERALQQFIRPAQYADRSPLTLSVWHAPGEPVPVAEAMKGAYEPFAAGTEWGRPWSTSWFRLEGTVPEAWAGRHVEVVVNGVKVADSQQPHLLFETGLPTRYYLPQVDVRMDLLHPSSLSLIHI